MDCHYLIVDSARQRWLQRGRRRRRWRLPVEPLLPILPGQIQTSSQLGKQSALCKSLRSMRALVCVCVYRYPYINCHSNVRALCVLSECPFCCCLRVYIVFVYSIVSSVVVAVRTDYFCSQFVRWIVVRSQRCSSSEVQRVSPRSFTSFPSTFLVEIENLLCEIDLSSLCGKRLLWHGAFVAIVVVRTFFSCCLLLFLLVCGSQPVVAVFACGFFMPQSHKLHANCVFPSPSSFGTFFRMQHVASSCYSLFYIFLEFVCCAYVGYSYWGYSCCCCHYCWCWLIIAFSKMLTAFYPLGTFL